VNITQGTGKRVNVNYGGII